MAYKEIKLSKAGAKAIANGWNEGVMKSNKKSKDNKPNKDNKKSK